MTRRGSPDRFTVPVEPQRLVAEPLDQAERVRDQQDGLAAPPELAELVEALVREALVAHREHLVDEQTSGSTWMATAKPSRMYMPDEYVFTGASMKSFSSANSTISSKRLLDLPLRQAEHDAVDEDVLAPGDLRVEAGAELDQRRDPAVDRDLPGGRLRDAGDHLSIVLLPEPLRPMMP